jgi:hypothetical protein
MRLAAASLPVACLLVLGCSGSWWSGHVHAYDGGAAGSAPGYAPPERLDGGTPIPPPIVAGWIPVPGGSEEPTSECAADEDCPPVDCTCEDGESFTAQACDQGACAVPDDCPYMCGDVSPDVDQ